MCIRKIASVLSACIMMYALICTQSFVLAAEQSNAILSIPGCGAGVSCLSISGPVEFRRGTLKTGKFNLPGPNEDALVTFQTTLVCSGPKGASVRVALFLDPDKNDNLDFKGSVDGSTTLTLSTQDNFGNFETQPMVITKKILSKNTTLNTPVRFLVTEPQGVTCNFFGGAFVAIVSPHK